MQPAVAECVQNEILPASAATAIARFGAMRSLPGCGHLARGSPKSSRYVTDPTTGKTSRGTSDGAADPAVANAAAAATTRSAPVPQTVSRPRAPDGNSFSGFLRRRVG